ncbi:MAG: hypothetical protein F4X02_14215 [Chloroflexi bacterium]|nr:hypothetical protein [Chloroflexota bacterium]
MDILWAQLVDEIKTDHEDNRVLDYGYPVHILEYGGLPARSGEVIVLAKPIVLLCKWGRLDATTFGDVYYAASLTSPDFSTSLMKVDADGTQEVFFPVSIPPQEYEWFTYLQLSDIIYRGDGCYRITISGARYGIPVHLSTSYIASVGFMLRRRLDDGQDQQTTAAMYGTP